MNLLAQLLAFATDTFFVPRFRRITPPGSVVHVISRIANAEFRIRTTRERSEYLTRLAAVLERSDWTVFAYAVMSNHIHLATIAGESQFWRLAKPLNTGFGWWLNQHQKRTGYVFEGRPNTITMDRDRAGVLAAYIHNNPVRANVTDAPESSTWTSHRAYCGVAAPPPWLDVQAGLRLAGFGSASEPRERFREFVAARSGDARDPTLSGDETVAARAQLRQSLGAPVEVSNPIVSQQTATRYEMFGPNGIPTRARWDGPALELVEAVADYAGLPVEWIQSRRRARTIVDARRLVLNVGHGWLGRDIAEMGAIVGISRQAASRLLRDDKTTKAKTAARVARRVAGEEWLLQFGLLQFDDLQDES